jgi:hypothetical protein
MGIDHFSEEGTRLENMAEQEKEVERKAAAFAAEKKQRSANLFNGDE